MHSQLLLFYLLHSIFSISTATCNLLAPVIAAALARHRCAGPKGVLAFFFLTGSGLMIGLINVVSSGAVDESTKKTFAWLLGLLGVGACAWM
jgi:hypothetical protein